METKEVCKSKSKGKQSEIEIIIPHISEDNLEDAIKKVTKKYKGNKERYQKTDAIDSKLLSNQLKAPIKKPTFISSFNLPNSYVGEFMKIPLNRIDKRKTHFFILYFLKLF